MNCLEIVQQAANAIGVDEPSTLENTADKQTKKLISLLNRVGNNLVKEFNWRELCKITTFTSTGASSYDITTDLLLPDYNSITISNIYNTTTKLIIVPQSAEQYQTDQLYLGASPFYKLRFLGNKIYFTPAVPTGEILQFEYKIKNWLSYDDGVNPISYKELITKNIDTPLINSELLVKALIWKYKDAGGLTYDEDFREYEKYLENLKNSNRDFGILDFNRNRYIDISNIPNTSY